MSLFSVNQRLHHIRSLLVSRAEVINSSLYVFLCISIDPFSSISLGYARIQNQNEKLIDFNKKELYGNFLRDVNHSLSVL